MDLRMNSVKKGKRPVCLRDSSIILPSRDLPNALKIGQPSMLSFFRIGYLNLCDERIVRSCKAATPLGRT